MFNPFPAEVLGFQSVHSTLSRGFGMLVFLSGPLRRSIVVTTVPLLVLKELILKIWAPEGGPMDLSRVGGCIGRPRGWDGRAADDKIYNWGHVIFTPANIPASIQALPAHTVKSLTYGGTNLLTRWSS